jgi:hypothetical protein
MNTEKASVTYTNKIEFNGRILAFKKKYLFDITNTCPMYIPFNLTHNCWFVKSKELSLKKAKELCKEEVTVKDLSSLQWYQQIQLIECFNLEN